MSTIDLSLVTPALNQRAYLQQCLANVRRLGPRVEHVVVDGASHDGTQDELQRAQQRRGSSLRYISRPDGGMYEAVNEGIHLCQAAFLGYLNCDDLLLPWTPELVLGRFTEEDAPDLVYGDALEWDGDRGRAALVVQPPAWLLPSFLRAGGHLAQPAIFFRRSLFDKLGGFDPAYRLLGDHDFWLRAVAAGARFAKVSEVLAVQRVVPGQLMQRHAVRVDIERTKAHRQASPRVPGSGSRRAAGWISSALMRQGLLRLAGRDMGDRLLGLRTHRPWQHTLQSGLLTSASVLRTAQALVRSTRGRHSLCLVQSVLWQLTGSRDLKWIDPT